MKRIIECKIPYVREVRLGIDTENPEDALWIARELLESPGDLNLDSSIPVFRDSLEEEDTGKTGHFQVIEELADDQEWPLPEPSVDALRRRRFANEAALLLVRALSEPHPNQELLNQAYSAALRATGRLDGGEVPTSNRVVIVTEGGVIQSVVAERPHGLRIAEVDYSRDVSAARPPIVEHPVEQSGLELDEIFNQAESGRIRQAS